MKGPSAKDKHDEGCELAVKGYCNCRARRISDLFLGELRRADTAKRALAILEEVGEKKLREWAETEHGRSEALRRENPSDPPALTMACNAVADGLTDRANLYRQLAALLNQEE